MSWHVLHILTPEVRLSKYRGFLQCEGAKGEVPQRMPFEDLKAIVMAARGITLSSEVLRMCMEHKVILVHCDKRYAVCGFTIPALDITNPDILRRQITNLDLRESLWQRILRRKIENQIRVLELIKADTGYLRQYLEKTKLNESAAARQYFAGYFRALGEPSLTRRHDDGHIINMMLNYGYAVLQAMLHRSAVVYGLSPFFGIHHIERYQAHPLIYDLMEPWRPFLDLIVWAYLKQTRSVPDDTFKDFKQYIGFSQNSWQQFRLAIGNKYVKMINSVDYYTSSLANTYLCNDAGHLWLPAVETSHYTDLIKWDGRL